MAKGYVYILTNPSMPGLVKVGKTTSSPDVRALQLYTTGVPEPFQVAHAVLSPDCHELEETMHSVMAEIRVSSGREFFDCSPEFALGLLDAAHADQVESWMNEFLPMHRLVADDAFIDPSIVYMLADRLGQRPETISLAMSCISEQEAQPFVTRAAQKLGYEVLP